MMNEHKFITIFKILNKEILPNEGFSITKEEAIAVRTTMSVLARMYVKEQINNGKL